MTAVSGGRNVLRPPGLTRRQIGIALGALLAGTAASLAGIVYAGFVWDDADWVVPFLRRAPAALLWESLHARQEGGGLGFAYYRPLVPVSFAVDGWLWGPRPAGLHLSNLILYLGCAALAYPLARSMLGTHQAALGATAVFALHPVHVEVVAWLQGRADLLAFAGGAAALACFLRALDRGFSLPLLGGIGLGFLAGLLSKESALVVPGLAVACWALRAVRPPARRAAWAFLPFLVSLGFYAWLRAGAGAGAAPAPDLLTTADRLLLTPVVFAKYVGLLLWPYPLNAYYVVPPPAGVADLRVLGGTAILIGALVATVWSIRRARRVSLALLWFLMGIAPVLPLAPLRGFTMAERYLFFPSFGFALAAGLAGEALWRRATGPAGRRAALGAGAAVAATWVAVTMGRVPDWVEQTGFYRAMVRTSPESAFAHNNLGQLLVAEGMLEDGIRHLERAVAIHPDMAYAHAGLGVAHWKRGDLARASEAFQTAARLRPNDPRILRDLAAALTQQARWSEAAAVGRRLETMEVTSPAQFPNADDERAPQHSPLRGGASP